MEEECCLCLHPYDETVHVPLILGNCGHTFCKECINEVEPLTPQPVHRVYLCPICKKPNVSTLNTPQSDEFFPRNYTLLGMIARKNRGVDCNHEAREFFCLDNRCKNGATACLKCVGRLHANCSDANIRRSNEARFVSELHLEAIADAFDCEGLSEMIRDGLERLAELLKRYAGNFANSILRKQKFFEEVAINPSAVVKNKKDFELVEVEPSKFKIHLKEEKVETLRIAIREFMGFFHTTVFEQLAKTTETLIKDHQRAMETNFGEDFDLKLRFPTGRPPSVSMMELFKNVVENPGSYALMKATGEVLRGAGGPPRGRPNNRRETVSFRLNPNEAHIIERSVDEMLLRYQNVESLRKGVSQALSDRYQFPNDVRLHFGDPHELEAHRIPFFGKRLQTQDLWLITEIRARVV